MKLALTARQDTRVLIAQLSVLGKAACLLTAGAGWGLARPCLLSSSDYSGRLCHYQECLTAPSR